jgi:hypothetical protein
MSDMRLRPNEGRGSTPPPKPRLEQTGAQPARYEPASVGADRSTTETFNFDDPIDPRDARPLIIRALRTARAGSSAPLGPKTRHGIMP